VLLIHAAFRASEVSRARESEIQQSKRSQRKRNEWLDGDWRKRQGAAIHRWKLWERSSGPKTIAGKVEVARTA
jgi:hypothetical protein